MDNVLKEQLEDIDNSINIGNYKYAIEKSSSLLEKYPQEGIVYYYLGRISLVLDDNINALKHFLMAENKGYKSSILSLEIGLLLSLMDELVEAEKHFLDAAELSENQEMRWAALSTLAIFYIQNEMYLKAEKISKNMISDYPNNFQGYHLHIMAGIVRGNCDEVYSYMEKLPDAFKNHPQYLIDIIELYRKLDKVDEMIELFETDRRFKQNIPQIVLREKINYVADKNEKEKLIYILASKYHDADAVFSTMILEFSKGNYMAASKIANVIMDNEKRDLGIRFFLALYIQMHCLYYLSEKKPSNELIDWIEKAGNWCVRYANKSSDLEIVNAINDSVQQLFDEINCSMVK